MSGRWRNILVIGLLVAAGVYTFDQLVPAQAKEGCVVSDPATGAPAHAPQAAHAPTAAPAGESAGAASALPHIPLLGEAGATFVAQTTQGKITFPDDFQGKWVIPLQAIPATSRRSARPSS